MRQKRQGSSAFHNRGHNTERELGSVSDSDWIGNWGKLGQTQAPIQLEWCCWALGSSHGAWWIEFETTRLCVFCACVRSITSMANHAEIHASSWQDAPPQLQQDRVCMNLYILYCCPISWQHPSLRIEYIIIYYIIHFKTMLQTLIKVCLNPLDLLPKLSSCKLISKMWQRVPLFGRHTGAAHGLE